MIEINGNVYRNIQEQVEKNMEDIAELKQKELYLHSIHISAKLYDAGEESNTFIASFRVMYFNNSSEQLKADDLEDMLADARLMASGFSRNTATEKEYIPYELYLYNDVVYLGMATADYSPAGGTSTRLGTITSFVDKVVKLI